jgi:hypothetical protein
MSKVQCDCGHVIRDTGDELSYKARFLPDQNKALFLDQLSQAMAELIDLTSKGRRHEWIAKHFKKGYPNDLDTSSFVSDYVWGHLIGNSGVMYQCENCGRILIYRDPNQNANVFVPGGLSKEVLRRIDPTKQ